MAGDAGVAVAPGGGIVAPEEGVEEIGAEVKAAAEGEIIDTIPGAYFFALSRKPHNSGRVQPWKELTLSQPISSP
jgi:hypothetical protein